MGAAFDTSMFVAKIDPTMFLSSERKGFVADDTFSKQSFESVLQDTMFQSRAESSRGERFEVREADSYRNRLKEDRRADSGQSQHAEENNRADRAEDGTEQQRESDAADRKEADDQEVDTDQASHAAEQSNNGKKVRDKRDDESETDLQDEQAQQDEQNKESAKHAPENGIIEVPQEIDAPDTETEQNGLPLDRIVEDTTEETATDGTQNESQAIFQPEATADSAEINHNDETQNVEQNETISEQTVGADPSAAALDDTQSPVNNTNTGNTTLDTDAKNEQAAQSAQLQDSTNGTVVSPEEKSADVDNQNESDEIPEENADMADDDPSDEFMQQESKDQKPAHQQKSDDTKSTDSNILNQNQPQGMENVTVTQANSAQTQTTTQPAAESMQQIMQEKMAEPAQVKVSEDGESKQGIDILSGADQVKAKETAAQQVKQETIARNNEEAKAMEQDVIRQVQARMQVRNLGDVKHSEITFNLHPKHLGQVDLKLVMENNVLTARMRVDNDSVKQILESNIADLRRNLSSQGVKVEKVEVTVKSDTDTMGSFEDRRAAGHEEQKTNYEYVTRRSKRFGKPSESPAEKQMHTSYNRQQTLTADGRLNYLV